MTSVRAGLEFSIIVPLKAEPPDTKVLRLSQPTKLTTSISEFGKWRVRIAHALLA